LLFSKQSTGERAKDPNPNKPNTAADVIYNDTLSDNLPLILLAIGASFAFGIAAGSQFISNTVLE
jgi:hypothetical protein